MITALSEYYLIFSPLKIPITFRLIIALETDSIISLCFKNSGWRRKKKTHKRIKTYAFLMPLLIHAVKVLIKNTLTQLNQMPVTQPEHHLQ